MNIDREPCPVCGRQPNRRSAAQSYLACDHGDWHRNGELQGPGFDKDGSKWDGMCRAIRARALADVRAKVPQLQRWTPSYTGPDSMIRSAQGLYLDIADVLYLLDDNKEDDNANT